MESRAGIGSGVIFWLFFVEISGDSNSDSSWEEPLEPIPPMEPAPRLVPIPTMEPFPTLPAGRHVYKCYVCPSLMKNKYSFLLVPCLLILSNSAYPTKELFPAMEPILEVVPIPAMVPAPIKVPAPAWNRLQLRLFESNSDSDS